MIINAAAWQRPKLKNNQQVEIKVAEMLVDIQKNTQQAIDQYAQKLDGQSAKFIKLNAFESYPLDEKLAVAIKFAANRIEKFAMFQKSALVSRTFSDEFGTFGQTISPIERIGAYIPAGRYPLISSALMTLIPARIAGCATRIACSPSNHPAILAAASLAGATEFIQLGGVQAIGALAFGYQSVKPVDLVVGPGNAWVNEAKKQLQGRIKIDGLAGPSELLIIADKEQPIEWLALDALAQTEHDPLACSLIVSDDKKWLDSMLSFLENSDDGKKLLNNNQVQLILAKDKQVMIAFSDNYSPEHLMLCHKNITQQELSHYGALFIGVNSAVALGDYISGPNHTLPTLGYARQNGGLSVHDFLRIQCSQQINDVGRQKLSAVADHIAQAEGLIYHSKSLQVRC